MSKRKEQIVECFMLNWDLFGDHKSTEFLVQVTADQTQSSAEDVYGALEWESGRSPQETAK